MSYDKAPLFPEFSAWCPVENPTPIETETLKLITLDQGHTPHNRALWSIEQPRQQTHKATFDTGRRTSRGLQLAAAPSDKEHSSSHQQIASQLIAQGGQTKRKIPPGGHRQGAAHALPPTPIALAQASKKPRNTTPDQPQARSPMPTSPTAARCGGKTTRRLGRMRQA